MAPTTNLLGTSTASVGVYNTAAITTSKDLNITGVSTSQSNTQGGVTLNASITTGSTGKVDITSTDTAGGSNWAYNQNAGVNINAGSGGVTINATGSGSNSALNILGNITTTGAVSLTGNAGTGGGNGIYTSGTIGISGTSVTMNGIGGTTGGVGAFLNSGTTFTASTGDVSITASKPSSTSTAAINLAGTINGVSTKSINLTGGLTGAGSIVNNGAAVILNNAMSALDVYAGVISGTGSLIHQTGKQTISGTNTYSGSTSINSGTLQVGSGGGTGTLGAGDVTLANGAGLVYNRNVDTVINNTISGNGTVSATITGNLDVAKTVNLSTVGNIVNLSASGNITQSAGSITATNLFLNATAGGIGTSSNRITSNVTNLAMSSAGNQFASQVNALNLAAKTTGSGNIDVKTTSGTLNVASVNGINGVTSAGTGNITLDGTSTGTSGTGLNIAANITGNGDVVLTGKTAADNRPNNNVFAGVTNGATVTAKNITLNALASNTTADVLGYYGAGGSLIATNNLTATAESKGAGVGFYMWSGKTQSGTGMSVTGITNTDTGVALDNGAQIINKVVSGSASGNLVLTGSTNSTTRAGFGLIKANIENTSANGGIQITASKGDIRANYGQANTIVNAGSEAVVLTAGPSSATDAGAINGANLTLTQNGNGGVSVLTSGTGNVTAPKIVNAGTGSVVVAAGTAIAAGTGTGGQVKTVSGNTITQNSTGKTYIYTGNATDTGALSNLGGFSNGLFLSTIGTDAKNAASNAAFGSTISGGANAQVVFREKLALSGALNNATVTYGDSTNSAAVKAALQAVNPTTGSDNAISTTATAGTFKILKADLMADMAAGKPSVDTALSVASNKSTSGNLKASDTGYAIDVAGNNYNLNGVTATLKVAQKSLSAIYAANNKVFDGGVNAIVTGALKDAIAGDAVTPSHSSATFESADVGTNKAVTVSGITLTGKDAANYKVDPVVNSSNRATTKANITAVTPTPPVPVVPNVNASKVKIPTGSSNPFALASVEDLDDGTCTANNIENCYCEESSVGQGVDICYEPKPASR
jgi:hypothetical protein